MADCASPLRRAVPRLESRRSYFVRRSTTSARRPEGSARRSALTFAIEKRHASYISKRAPSSSFALSTCSGKFGETILTPADPRLRPTQRFREPLHISDDSNGDILRPLILREARLRQEEDIGSSAEITVWVGLTQISCHGKNRCVFHQQSVAPIGAFRSRSWARQDNFRDNSGDRGVPATRSLTYTYCFAVRWPRG